MPNKRQSNGMRGVYLVAAELARIGLIASPTSRSARGADILATTDDCNKAFSVEVKTTTNNSFWQLGKHAKTINTKSHVYVFVRIKKAKQIEPDEITYYPVTSNFICKNARLPDPTKRADDQYREGFSIDASMIQRFKGNWNVFGITKATNKRLRVNRY